MVMSDMIGRNTHPVTNPIQAGLKLLRPKEFQSSVFRPFFPHEALSLETCRPVDGPAATPCRASNHTDGAIIGDLEAAVLIQVYAGVSLGHGQVLWWEVVGFVYHHDTMTGIREVLCADAAAASTPDDHDVGFNDLGRVAWRELEEVVFIVRAGLVV